MAQENSKQLQAQQHQQGTESQGQFNGKNLGPMAQGSHPVKDGKSDVDKKTSQQEQAERDGN
jgi:hypothetical protein